MDSSPLRQFLPAMQATAPDLKAFGLDMLLVFVLAWLIGVSARRSFLHLGAGRDSLIATFPMLSITTLFVISTIKTSLALSLGLVGALSIVRFRTAVREPEELGYIFLCIALGVGIGAGQREFSILAVLVLVSWQWFQSGSKRKKRAHRSLLQLGFNDHEGQLGWMMEQLNSEASSLRMLQFTASKGRNDLLFEVEFSTPESFYRLKQRLQERLEELEVRLTPSQTT